MRIELHYFESHSIKLKVHLCDLAMILHWRAFFPLNKTICRCLFVTLLCILTITIVKFVFTVRLFCGEVYDYRLPPTWREVAKGFTVDCVTGVPDTRFWPHVERPLACSDFVPEAVGLVVNEDAQHRKALFTDIFRKRLWNAGDLEKPASGPGSTLENTIEIRTTLDRVLNDIKYSLNKKSLHILDIPCGDMGWMSVFLRNRTDIRYTGMDIVPDLIEQHRDAYANRNWRFEVHDIVVDPLSSSYDLIFSRQLTQHLTPADTLRVLNHFSTSGSHFTLLTTYPQTQQLSPEELENKFDVSNPLRYFGQNLEEAPYGLAPPICVRTSLPFNYKLDYNALWRLPLKQKLEPLEQNIEPMEQKQNVV